jgi:nitroreductase
MNETVSQQLSHCSIRAFSDEAISEETIDTLLAVANRTATSMLMQRFSIVRVTDAETKCRISTICEQAYISRLPEIFIFIADCYRNYRIASAQGFYGESLHGMDAFFQAFTDTCLAAQNVAMAIESFGMGAVFFGSLLNDSQALIDILGLPELTFPVLGLGFGHPAQDPQPKPRLDVSFKVFENRYTIFDDYLELIADYDKEMQTYRDKRNNEKHSDSFSEMVVKKSRTVREKRALILRAVRKQGFDPKLDS